MNVLLKDICSRCNGIIANFRSIARLGAKMQGYPPPGLPGLSGLATLTCGDKWAALWDDRCGVAQLTTGAANT